MSTPLDNRHPSTGASRRQQIIAALQKSEALDVASLATRIGLGVPLTLLAPFILSTLILGCGFRLDFRWPVGFIGTFFLLSLVLVPLLMWYERRTRGSFWTDAASDHGNPFEASSMGEYEMNQTRAAAAAYVEIALTGPRLLWEAIDRLQGRGKLDTARIAAAAEIADELLAAGQNIEIRQLVTPERPIGHVRNLIEFLKHHDWADTSSDGKRVWIRSHVAKQL